MRIKEQDVQNADADIINPRCCYCGRFVKMSEASLSLRYDIGGTYEPPDPEWICPKCANGIKILRARR